MNKKLINFALTMTLSTIGFAAVPEKSLNDGEVAKIVATTNEGEVKLARLALLNSHNKNVQNFATHMIKDHSENTAKAQLILGKNRITPTETPESQMLKSKADMTLTRMEKLKDTEFDKAYIDDQIKAHQTVLNDMDKKFLPNVKNSEFKDLLEKTKPVVQHHLHEAQEIQASL